MVVGGRDTGHDGGEMGGMAFGRQPLGGADVRGAVHTDFACAPRLRGDPFHGVVAVVLLVAEGVEFPFGLMAPARVLDDHAKAVLRRFQGVERSAGQCLIIGSTLQNDGEWPVSFREVDIGV